MVFLFSLINISFTFFFFIFGHYIESGIFGVLSVIFIVYFSKVLSFFLEKENTEDEKHHTKNKITNKNLLKYFVEFLKKGSYYVAFLLFYCSLYGFIYSINLIYNFSDFSRIFHYITFIISFIISGIFFSFLQKKHETIFLIFRSNCIIFSIIYIIFLIFFLTKSIIPSVFIIINSIFPIVTLLSVIVYDSYIKEEKKYIFSLFLFYIFIVSNYFVISLFSTTPVWYIFLGISSIFMIIYTFLFPRIIYFYSFKYISELVGIILGSFITLCITLSIFVQTLTFYYLFLLGISILYHYTVYKYFKNLISYIIFLCIFVFLYIKLFILLGIFSFFGYILFIFLLPYIFIGIGYIIQIKQYKSLYILHTIGMSFNIIALGYYFFQVGSLGDILVLSTVLFFESILVFLSYIGLKK